MTKKEALEKILATLENGTGVLLSNNEDLDLPTIHSVGTREGQAIRSIAEVRHAGFGLFLGTAPDGNKFSFDGGGAMSNVRTEDDKHLFSYTLFRADYKATLESAGYDFEAAIATVKAALEEVTE